MIFVDYNIQKDFMSCGLRCLIVRTDMGHLCGYTQVLSTHKAATKHYDDIYPDVHGGLTFSSKDDDSDAWWFGFDCAHCDDWTKHNPTGHEWTIVEVENECRKLAEYLSTYTDEVTTCK